jgi:rubrerythrin
MAAKCIEGNILKQALQMEQESREFYLNAARKVENKLGRQMLESIAKDEEGHHTLLLQLQEGAAGTALGECRAEYEDAGARLRALFSEYGAQAAEEVSADTDDLEALNIAMEMERKGYNLYKEAASKASDPSAGKVFVFLAGEEEKHFEVLQNMHRYLSDPRAWFLEQEHGLLDGG